MPETITIYAESVEDISPLNHDSIEVTLSGVDLGNLVAELDHTDILDCVDLDEIKEYIENKEKEKTEDE